MNKQTYERAAGTDTLDRVDVAVFALNELLLYDRARLTERERDLIDAADLAVNQVQDAIRTRLGLTDSAGNDIPDHAHTDYGQACRHGCYGYCGTCN